MLLLELKLSSKGAKIMLYSPSSSIRDSAVRGSGPGSLSGLVDYMVSKKITLEHLFDLHSDSFPADLQL